MLCHCVRMVTQTSKLHVFCLEGDWDARNLADRKSVLPVLELLDSLRKIRFIRRDVGTVEEFEHYIKKWTQRLYGHYWMLYLCFHGNRGSIQVGGRPYSLDRLASLLSVAEPGGVVHFGSCETLRVPGKSLDAFAKAAKLHSVSGYTKSVDWAESAVLDAALLDAVANHQTRVRDAYKVVDRDYAGLVKRLGFHHT